MTGTQLADLIREHAGGGLMFPGPVTLTGESNQTFDFGNMECIWGGLPDQSIFTLTDCQACVFRNLKVIAVQPGLSAFDVTRSPNPQAPTPTSCRWEDVVIDGDGLTWGYRVDHSIGGGPDANLDNMQWTRCSVNGVARSMWYFAGPQSMLHSLTRCGGDGRGKTRHCVESIDTNTIRVEGGGGDGLTDYAYLLGQRGGGFGGLDGPVWESCKGGLLSFPGNEVTGIQFQVQNCRYDQNGPGPATIVTGQQVPALSIERNLFESHPDAAGKWVPCKVTIGASKWTKRQGGSVIVRQNAFSQPAASPTVPPVWPSIEISQNVPTGNQDTMGNQWWQGGQYVDAVRVVKVP